MPHSQNQTLFKPGLHISSNDCKHIIANIFTIVTTVVSPHAKEVNYIENVHIDGSVKIMNLINLWNTDVNLYISHRFSPFLDELILMKYTAAKHLQSLW